MGIARTGLQSSGQHPFQLWTVCCREFVSLAISQPKQRTRFVNSLGINGRPSVPHCPGWRRLSVEDFDDTRARAFGEARSIQALVCFLEALGSPQVPALVILDDCQCADELTVKLIAKWTESNSHRIGQSCHVLLVVAYRSEEIPAEHPFGNFPQELTFACLGLNR